MTTRTSKTGPTQEASLDLLKGWEKLTAAEKNSARQGHAKLVSDTERLGKDWIAVGEDLLHQRDIFEPHRMFDAYLKLLPFGLSRASAYRRIRVAEKAKRALRPDLFQFALLNGLDRVDVEAIKVIPPPKPESKPAEIKHYLKSVSRRNLVSPEEEPEVAKKEVVNFFRLKFEKLPKGMTPKQRFAWATDCCGMEMTVAGASSEQKVEPVAIPIDFFRQRGRPRMDRAS